MKRLRWIAVVAGLLAAAMPVQAQQVYDGSEWVRFGCSTHMLNRSREATGDTQQVPEMVYDPARAWDQTPIEGQERFPFEGYRWLMTTATDSAAAGTAISTGVKTYNASINWSNEGRPLTTIVETAHRMGRRTGTISSVPFSHATPAALSNAHNVHRNNASEIALEMVYGRHEDGALGTPDNPARAVLDVIMGAGHPLFDNDHQPAEEPRYNDVGGDAAWADMATGRTASGFTVIQSKVEFEALAAAERVPQRVLGIVQVRATLQEGRHGRADKSAAPYEVPLTQNVPTLALMTRTALNVLDGSAENGTDRGFFLHVEGGAVDWAGHANHLGRMIEEQIDFNRAVEVVAKYLDENTHGNNWTNTLVIVTSDHETGFLLGPDARTEPYDGIVPQGRGRMPRHSWLSGGHTNQLVPLYARGPGSELFGSLATGVDEQYVRRFGLQGFSDRYVDNTDIHRVMLAALRGGTKNVVLFISDGAGFNTFAATTMYQYGLEGEEQGHEAAEAAEAVRQQAEPAPAP